MKALRVIHKLFGVAVIALACLFGWIIYASVRNGQEASRVERVQAALEAKLAAYHRAKGEYPDSLQLLSFTNSAQEAQMLPDIQKISYQHTPSGYVLFYEGASGYKNTRTFKNETLSNR